MISIRVKTLGNFHSFLTEEIVLQVKENTTVSEVRKILEKEYLSKAKELLAASVFSNDSMFLQEDSSLEDQDIIYLLPPVNGG